MNDDADLHSADAKVTSVLAGKVVRKDLVRKVKVGAQVPVFVLEYLLGKYCATDDERAIEAGLRVVNDMLAENIVKPNEANKAQSQLASDGRHRFIDKVKVRYVAEDETHWAEVVNFGSRYVHIRESDIRQHDRLLTGGLWADLELRHVPDEDGRSKRRPFWIDELKPIQIAAFDLDEYVRLRAEFTADEWSDLLMRSIGLEPVHFDKRTNWLFLARLLPLCEANYNLIELGPRGTGKSYAFQELSPYVILLTGPTTVANLFYNIAQNQVGLVGRWDSVAFDEVADLQKMPKEVITTLKTYCESGMFARGRETQSGQASIALFGNTNQPVEVMSRTSHLFTPLPDIIREDMAFIDRIHFYLPGWEIPKMRNEYFTDHYGFVVDYLAEALHDLRRQNFTERLSQHFSLGHHLNARDAKAVRKTVSGMLKILHPGGDCSRSDLAEIVDFALEGRRRVKEQLKKMGSFEYHQTSFSYIDNDTREERYVGVPEEGGRHLISPDPLAPGNVYTACVNDESKVGLYRIEVSLLGGSGRLKLPAGMDAALRQSAERAFTFIKARAVDLGVSQAIGNQDVHLQAVDLLGNHVAADSGVSFFAAIYSALKSHEVLPATIVLGDMTIQGNVKAAPSLMEALQLAMENGARRAVIPLENKRSFLDMPGDVVERVDPVFYSDAFTAGQKALGVG